MTKVYRLYFRRVYTNFLTHDLETLNNTLSISYGQRPLAAGPTRNAKIMKSLLPIN